MDWFGKNSLDELFKRNGIQTRGTQVGRIYKYRDFYLKIYSGKEEATYVVNGYRWGEDNPYFVDIVPMQRMRRYASQFWSCQ